MVRSVEIPTLIAELAPTDAFHVYAAFGFLDHHPAVRAEFELIFSFETSFYKFITFTIMK